MMPGLVVDLTWREPAWLWLAVMPWLWLVIRSIWSSSDDRAYADTALLPWARAQRGMRHGLRYWREACLVVAWLLLATALAGPRVPQAYYTKASDRLPELMVVLDVSHSMNADDMYPSRLERARLELHDLIARLDGWRAGMVLYTANPHLLLPPTDDKTLLRHYVQIPRTGLLPIEGSDPLAALRFAASIERQPGVPRVILLITDGETGISGNDYELALQETVTALRQQGVQLYILGMGSESGSTLTDPDGGWLEENGQAVISRLQAARLEHLAERGGGRYARASEDARDWQYLYDNGIARQAVPARLEDQRGGLIIWHELFVWPLVPGLFLLLLAHVRRAVTPSRVSMPALLGLVLLGQLMSLPQDAIAADSGKLQAAWQAFEQGDYLQAQQQYRQIAGYAGRMGEGGSAYRLEDYRAALQQFTRAVMLANNDDQRADALFNLGNSYARLERYQEAVTIYKDVLIYRSPDPRASQNLALARQRAREQALAEGGSQGRQGRGSRTRKLEEGESVTRGSLTLGDAETGGEGFSLNGKENSDTTPGENNQSGAILADESIVKVQDENWSYAITSVDQLDQISITPRSDPARLWQRMFEVEAGYPALLDHPVEKPGVKPW